MIITFPPIVPIFIFFNLNTKNRWEHVVLNKVIPTTKTINIKNNPFQNRQKRVAPSKIISTMRTINIKNKPFQNVIV